MCACLARASHAAIMQQPMRTTWRSAPLSSGSLIAATDAPTQLPQSLGRLLHEALSTCMLLCQHAVCGVSVAYLCITLGVMQWPRLGKGA
jgi:hypothetical protein